MEKLSQLFLVDLNDSAPLEVEINAGSSSSSEESSCSLNDHEKPYICDQILNTVVERLLGIVIFSNEVFFERNVATMPLPALNHSFGSNESNDLTIIEWPESDRHTLFLTECIRRLRVCRHQKLTTASERQELLWHY